jgi:hypothetical protein
VFDIGRCLLVYLRVHCHGQEDLSDGQASPPGSVKTAKAGLAINAAGVIRLTGDRRMRLITTGWMQLRPGRRRNRVLRIQRQVRSLRRSWRKADLRWSSKACLLLVAAPRRSSSACSMMGYN